MRTRSPKRGRPSLGSAKRTRLSMTLKPDLVARLEARARQSGASASRVAEELLEAGLQARAFEASLWESRLGRKATELAGLCKALGVKKLSLFGSVLRDEFRPDSDVDLLVEFLPGKTLSAFDLGGVQMDLQDFFGRKVDLVEPAGLKNPIRRKEILGSCQVVYAAG